MKQLKTFLSKYGLHSFLLPVFFVLHSYQQYYGLVSSATAISVLIKILLIFSIFTLVIFAFNRNANKSFQLTTLLGVIILFYGVIKEFFQFTLHAPQISRYLILLPLTFIVTVILIIYILKKKDFRKSNLFQNTLLLVFIFADSAILFTSSNSLFLQRNTLAKNTHLSL